MLCTSVWNFEGLPLLVVVAMAYVSETARKLRAAVSCVSSPLARVSFAMLRLRQRPMRPSVRLASELTNGLEGATSFLRFVIQAVSEANCAASLGILFIGYGID